MNRIVFTLPTLKEFSEHGPVIFAQVFGTHSGLSIKINDTPAEVVLLDHKSAGVSLYRINAHCVGTDNNLRVGVTNDPDTFTIEGPYKLGCGGRGVTIPFPPYLSVFMEPNYSKNITFQGTTSITLLDSNGTSMSKVCEALKKRNWNWRCTLPMDNYKFCVSYDTAVNLIGIPSKTCTGGWTKLLPTPVVEPATKAPSEVPASVLAILAPASEITAQDCLEAFGKLKAERAAGQQICNCHMQGLLDSIKRGDQEYPVVTSNRFALKALKDHFQGTALEPKEFEGSLIFDLKV